MNKKLILIVAIIGLLLLAGVVLIIVFVNEPGQTDIVDLNAKNIIFILADDMGWSDIGYAGWDALTPTLDKFARQGIILNQSYMYSLCTPSRSSILSGIYAEKLGMQHYVIPNENAAAVGIPHNIDLIPKYLKKYGYKSHIVGKWHVGSCSMDYTPVNRGFDSFYGFFYGETDYYSHRVAYFNNTSGLDFWNQSKESLEPILDKNDTYSTFTYNQRIREIIDSHDKKNPLFLFYAAQNPHSDPNFNVPSWYEQKFMNIENDIRRRIIAMTYLLDESVLNITKDLERNQMLDDTIIIFSSDNGGHAADYQRNYPLRGSKTTVFEGGHRVRSFIWRKDLTPSVYEGMFHAVDWLPTMIGAALDEPNDSEINEIDGVNQWGAILNNADSKRNSFIYNIDVFGSRFQKSICDVPTEAIRVDKWKLIRGCPGFLTDWYNLTDFNPSYDNPDKGELINGTRYFLFNLEDDPQEKRNLAAQMQEKLKEMEVKLDEFKSKTIEPQVKEPLEKYRDPKADPALWGDKFSPGWCSPKIKQEANYDLK